MSIGDRAVLHAVAQTFAGWDGEPVDLDATSPEATAGKYAELGLLGRGGLGEVMEVFDADLRRRVAMKRPRAEHINVRSTKALIREAQITAQLAHPNIPAVHTLGFDDEDRPYFTMVRLRGKSLAAVLAEDPVSRAWKLRTFTQIAYAVAFAHSLRVLHRDLKPENVMIGDFGQVHLVDWGIAKLIGEAESPNGLTVTSSEVSHTRYGAFKGTPLYAAPEQIRGDVEIDERADIYALGAVLYEMLAGRPPVQGDTVDAIHAQSQAGCFDPLDAEGAGINAILACSLSPDRADRYDSVLTMIDDIEALEQGRALSVGGETTARRMQRFYFGRSEGTNRMRNFEADMLVLCGFLFGIPLGSWFTGWITGWEWALVAAAAVAAIPPLWAYLGPRRDGDGPAGTAASVTRGTMASRDSKSD